MFFLAIIILLVWYMTRALHAPAQEVWFMMSIFTGLGYVGGFLDSRLFAKLDKNRANQLAKAEARYEAQFNPQHQDSNHHGETPISGPVG